MKHVTPSESEALLDLSKPSLEALSYLLRHREMWPAGFEWDCTYCDQCAMGLADRLWSVYIEEVAPDDFPSAAILIDANSIRGIKWCDVTPEMVADDIDAYLAHR
jgi:hypothetical protein